MSRKIYCEAGKHDWEFTPKGPGRPPKNCPEHKAARLNPKATVIGDTPKGTLVVVPLGEIAEVEDNPFIRKAKQKSEAKLGPVPPPDKERDRPKRFTKLEVTAISDSNSYHDAALPGITIHELARDTTGIWTCKLTLNGETFDLVRRGGWLVVKPDGTGWREALPNVAAAIQERVNRLVKSDGKTLEQVADGVAPVSDEQRLKEHQQALLEHSEKRAARKAASKFEPLVCEACDRVQEPDEGGWKVIDEIQFCPACVAELGAQSVGAATEDELTDEELEGEGYSDILADPGQFDEPYADFAETIEQELG